MPDPKLETIINKDLLDLCNKNVVDDLNKLFFDQVDKSPRSKLASQSTATRERKYAKEKELLEFEENGGVEAVLQQIF